MCRVWRRIANTARKGLYGYGSPKGRMQFLTETSPFVSSGTLGQGECVDVRRTFRRVLTQHPRYCTCGSRMGGTPIRNKGKGVADVGSKTLGWVGGLDPTLDPP